MKKKEGEIMLPKNITQFIDIIAKLPAVWLVLVGLMFWFIRYYWFLQDRKYARPFIQPEYLNPGDTERRNLFKTVKSLLRNNSPNKYITILGEYGSGKSSFIDYLYYQLRKWQWISWYKKVKWIQLRDRNCDEKIKSIQDEEKNHTILLLDGFDEDPKAIANIKQPYQEIITMTRDYGKIVITSRLTFWGDLNPASIEVFYEEYHDVRKYFYLALFSEKQVKKYLRRKFWYRPLMARNLQLRINQNPCFRDISFRPQLLKYMNNDLLNGIEKSLNQTADLDYGLKNVKRKVFEIITNEVYEFKEFYFFEKERFDRIMALLGYDMIVKSNNISFADFETYFRDLRGKYKLGVSFNRDYSNTIKLESTTVKNQMLLIKRGEELQFSHRSFAEYYAALCIERYYLMEDKTDFTIPSKEVADFICFEKDNLRFIPGGKFMMGEGDTKHEVEVESFYMGICPVTNHEYELNPSNKDKRNEYSSADDEPVTNISWNNADGYCQWLSKKSGLLYRLPTEAEWEYACRAGGTGEYSLDLNGSEVTEKNLNEYAIYDTEKTMPVKQRKPNFYGLYDMHGNVREWCQDYYDDETNINRVVRGGSWNNRAVFLRVSYRDFLRPELHDYNLGFRVVACLARTP
jgi:hypothetical protein